MANDPMALCSRCSHPIGWHRYAMMDGSCGACNAPGCECDGMNRDSGFDTAKALAEEAANWAISSTTANVTGSGLSEIDKAWKHLEDLLESTYKDAEKTHDGMVYFEVISDIQAAVADLKRLISEDESE